VINYPWYEDLKSDDPLSQGDLIKACPVLTYSPINLAEDQHAVKVLEAAVIAQEVDCIVMTQSCDLAYGHVREVILCPVYDVSLFKKNWEEQVKEKGQNPTLRNWQRKLNEIREGKIWNLSLLNQRAEDRAKSESAIPFQIVEFHEIFSLPKSFLLQWMKQNSQPRMRLLPPYREHLSQAFARYFMRVGLPEDIPSFQ
jgi:hypothetical protein